MTPAEHLAEAERLIGDMVDSNDSFYLPGNQAKTWLSVAHALIAVAAELGVPHSETTAGGAGSAPQA